MPKVYSRRRGSKEEVPQGAVYVGRPTPLGNPFTTGSRNEICDLFEAYAVERAARQPGWLKPLIGKDLVCWCAPKRCHAQTLLRLANMASTYRPDGTQILWHTGSGIHTPTGRKCSIKTWLDDNYELHAEYADHEDGFDPYKSAPLEDLEPDPYCEEYLSEDGHLEHILEAQRIQADNEQRRALEKGGNPSAIFRKQSRKNTQR